MLVITAGEMLRMTKLVELQRGHWQLVHWVGDYPRGPLSLQIQMPECLPYETGGRLFHICPA